jgi:hypothetical protein
MPTSNPIPTSTFKPSRNAFNFPAEDIINNLTVEIINRNREINHLKRENNIILKALINSQKKLVQLREK